MDLNIVLILSSFVVLSSIFLNKFSNKVGIPTLIFFLGVGIFFTHPSGLNIHFANYLLTEKIASICLIFIIFYGGFGTRWEEAKKVVQPAIVLSTFGAVLTAASVTLFCHFILHFGLLESFLMGSVISSTDAASVFSIIRSRRLSLKYRTSSLLEIESGSNDPASYLLTIIAIGLLNKDMSQSQVIVSVFSQIIFGLLFGFLAFKICKLFLTKIKIAEGFDIILIFAISILTFSATSYINGNGYLAVYLYGILLGNSKMKNKVALVYFYDAFTNLMQIALFFTLGFLSDFHLIVKNMPIAFLIFLFLTFIARSLVVEGAMAFFKPKMAQKAVISVAGLRGAASIVFAIMARNQIVGTTQLDIFHVTFGIVLLSILIQGSLLPFVSTKLDMIDLLQDPLKSFTDYSNETPIEFITFVVDGDHFWKDKKLEEMDISRALLVVFINRNGERILPNGKTVIREGDKIVCIAKSFTQGSDIHINEVKIEEDNAHIGTKLKDFEKEMLVILINRGGKYIIPRGDNKLLAGDKVLYLESANL